MNERHRTDPTQLEARIRRLLGGEERSWEEAPPPPVSPYRIAPNVEEFDIPLAPGARVEEDLEVDTERDAADEWLDMPSPTFGGQSPRYFLNGTESQRAFLAGIVDSIEDGAFS